MRIVSHRKLIVIEYEKEHFPIEKPTVAELIKEEISCHK